MPRASVRAAIVALSALLLQACAASGVVLYQTDVASQYSGSTLGLIGSGRHDLKVVVQGNPFAASDADLVDAVVDGLEGRTSGIPVKFSPTPENPFPRGDYWFGFSSVPYCLLVRS